MIRPAVTALLLVIVLAACGTARTKALSTSLSALDVAADVVVEVSNKRQEQIVDQATSAEDGRAKLDAFRAARAPVIDVIARAYKAIAAAALGNGELTAVTSTVHDAIERAKEWSK
jgi:hypothetical protein